MDHQRIALALIAGDGREDEIKRCVESAFPFVDGVFIAFNGKGSPPVVSDPSGRVPVVVDSFDWVEDFSVSRTQSFAMVPDGEYDWILWIDTDDTLEGGDQIQTMLNDLPSEAEGVFLRYDYFVENDEAVVVQWRERFLRVGVPWKWVHPIHETCHAPPGTTFARRDDVWVRHWRDDGNAHGTRKRNRKILSKAMRDYPDEPRFTYYMGNEVYAEAAVLGAEHPNFAGTVKAAIKLYSEFIEKTPWNDDSMIANSNMAECYRMLDEFNKAIDVDLQSIKLNPQWPHGYVGVAKSCMALREWSRQEHWANLALVCADPDLVTTQVIEPLIGKFHPHLLRGIAREEQKKYDEALEDYLKCEQVHPSEEVSTRIGVVKHLIEQPDGEKYDWMDDRIGYKNAQPERSVAIVVRPLFEAWHPLLEGESGFGGAETCVMRLAEQFRNDGWRVVVFGTPGYKGWHAGIEWYDSGDFDPSEDFTVVISSRTPEVFDTRIKAKKKFLWMHDVNVGMENVFESPEWGPRQITSVVALTEWHRTHMSHLYDRPLENFSVVPNGVDLTRFQRPDEWSGRDEDSFVWMSSPDRGLDTLLSIWPSIKENNPKASLHVYYGWTAIDKIGTLGRSDLLEFRDGVMELVDSLGGESGGIYWHDRVPQRQYAEELTRYGFWAYPTHFCETFCISAVEAQLSGVLPVVSDLGALSETTAPGTRRTLGMARNTSFLRDFHTNIKNLGAIPYEDRQSIRVKNYEWARQFSWENAYREHWLPLIEGAT